MGDFRFTDLKAPITGPEIVEDFGGDLGFRILWQVTENICVDFKVYEITGREDPDNAPIFDTADCRGAPELSLAQTYVFGTMKWDACCHFYFGQANNSGYIHMCGKESFAKHMALINHLHARAPELMERDAEDRADWWGEPLLPTALTVTQ